MLITDKELLKNFYSKKRVWQLVPGIERTHGGRIFSTFYSGRSTETLGNYCILLKSDDDGKSFGEPIAVVYNGEMSRCFDPVLWIDPLGRLWFTWAVGHRYGLYAVICDDPDADELSWSEEFYIGEGVMMNKPTVLSTGEWLFPISLWDYWYTINTFNRIKQYGDIYLEDYCKKEAECAYPNVYKSTDNGKTIKLIGSVTHINNKSHDEHMIYERADGVLVMLIRVKQGIARSYSYDGGRSWTVAEDACIAGPESRFHVRRLKSGRLLLINHDNFNGRNNLTAFLSEDEGESWPYKLLLDERDNVSYPDATEGDNGYLYITYDRERGGYKKSLCDTLTSAREILLAKISESDIMAGQLNSKDGFLKGIVSKLSEYEGKEDFFTGRPPMIAPTEFVSTVLEKERGKILENLYVFYPIDFNAVNTETTSKIDKLIEQVITDMNDDVALRASLITLTEFLSTLPLVFDLTRGEKYIDALMKHVRESIGSTLDIEEFANEHGISRYYLCHLFAKKIGMSVWDYREQYRLIAAKRMLVGTDKEFDEICAECGFYDIENFNKKFLENTGTLPAQYRNEKR